MQILDFQNKELEVIVPEDQLSLAIGRKGQNVRLAAKLIGWHVDIRSEEEMKREVESQMEALLSGASVPLTIVDTIDQVMSDMLQRGGIRTVEQLAESSVDDVTSIVDVSLDEAERLIGSARRVMEVKRLRTAQQAGAEGSAAPDEEDEGAAGAEESAAVDVEMGTDATIGAAVPLDPEAFDQQTDRGYDEAVRGGGDPRIEDEGVINDALDVTGESPEERAMRAEELPGKGMTGESGDAAEEAGTEEG